MADGCKRATKGAARGCIIRIGGRTRNALFLRMKSDCFACDPHPDLPACFANRERMKKLLSGVGEGNTPATAAEETASSAGVAEEHVENDWRPERLFRTCLSSLEDSDAFGRMMEVEADARGFYHAAKKAFVSDGLPYNWTIQKRHFRDFTPILDFVHAVEHLYEAARSVHDDAERRWMDYLRWARDCWSGNVLQVIAELREHQQQVGLPPKDCEKTDPRKVLADAVGYFQNNVSRMDYPAYRRQGLPTTSALHGVVRQRDQRPRERDRKVLERRGQRRSDPANPGCRPVRG